ncbi:MAG: efflux RND transporter permease subunit [Pikeienuella sp.]|uniref:efflux RND transporter permease subunit n=1 Tax=Pikeienuella sp. TaxID=2831957 RepID=UPI00391B3390
MTGLVTWAVQRSRMILALAIITVAAGLAAYVNLPKEGSPDIDVPVLYVSVPLPGVSASDAERLIVKPLESELRGLEGLDEMTGIATENHGAVLLKFDFGWDKAATLAEVRNKVDRARSEMPGEIEEPQVIEVNLSQFPVLVISLSGDAPERTLLRAAKDMQREIESLSSVLEVGLAGHRDEMLEVLIDPLRMEAYNVTAQELLNVVSANNALVAAGALETGTGAFSVKLPGSFETAAEIYELPVRLQGDRMVTLGDIATIRRTFKDAEGTARYNGETTVALQVKKRVGENIIETVASVRAAVAAAEARWPQALRDSVDIDMSMDESQRVYDMVGQLEGSVLTAVLLVVFVVVAALGFRSSLLVGVSIPFSFLLAFALLAVFGMSVNNMVMFGLILAVGMLVDGAIVVAEYADRRLSEGADPGEAYGEAARRMFWPIVSSTATTLCAFLPMLFWPGMPGQFMGQLPVTLIFVLSASLIVALIFLPVIGSVLARGFAAVGRIFASVGLRRRPKPKPVEYGYRRTAFGRVIQAVVGNPVMPFVAIFAAVALMAGSVMLFQTNGKGVEFFVKTEPERAIIHVRARGNLSLAEKDRLVRQVEQEVQGIEGVSAVFAFAGKGGLDQQGNDAPSDAVGQVQLELAPWGTRPHGDEIIEEAARRVARVPGVIAELSIQKDGPQQGKPIQLRLSTPDWETLMAVAAAARAGFEQVDGLVAVDDTRPLPGIDWEIDVDREMAGRFGTDIATIGTIVQLVTRGALLDTIRPDDSDDELDIRVRFPEQDRLLSTLEQLKLRTSQGLVPLSNFIEIRPSPSIGEIARFDTVRYIDVRADLAPGVNANEKIAEITAWLEANPLPPGVTWSFRGDQEEQAESMAFLGFAFIGALGLMFAILLAQFNSVYNSVLVLTAVVMSISGVLLGMVVMGQTFSIIMTGTGIVALAGIVVNNNIVLIDTYQEYAREHPRLEAIIRTAEQRIRPVLLTTVTTMAGLAPMMFATSLDFSAFGPLFAGGLLNAAAWSAFAAGVLDVGAPTALWWVQLATAVVFGLGVSTFLTLMVTPAALAIRVWVNDGLFGRYGAAHRALVRATVFGARRRRFFAEAARRRAMRKAEAPEFTWADETEPPFLPAAARPFKDAAE